jgi:phosphatidate cytidylyltransferase
MLTRVLAAVVGLPILIVLVHFGGWVLAAALFLVVSLGHWELYRCFGGGRLPYVAALILSAALMVVLTISSNAEIATFFEYYSRVVLYSIFVPLGLVIAFLLFLTKKNPWNIAFFGLFYVAGLMSALLLIRQSLGAYYVWLIFIAAWGCDTGAYFTGRAMGRHKLAPKLSPNKTVAGAVGGTITAAALCVLYAVILYGLGIWEDMGLIHFAVYGLIGAILAQVGDLTASAIKRSTDIKDFGRIIPGHGGILDRFDSILFVAPFALVFFTFIG